MMTGCVVGRDDGELERPARAVQGRSRGNDAPPIAGTVDAGRRAAARVRGGRRRARDAAAPRPRGRRDGRRPGRGRGPSTLGPMRLFLVRHAEAAPGEPDELRPLTDGGPRGRARARRAARRPSTSTPSSRARCCARARPPSAIARAAGLDAETDERLAPGADADDLRAAVAGRGETVVAVGHQPDCSEIVLALTGERACRSRRARCARSSCERRRASAACARATATTKRCAGSTSRSRPARSSACSARTAPARRRRSRSSRATASATAAASRCSASTRSSAGTRVARADRRRAAVLVALPEPDRAREPARLRRLLRAAARRRTR